MPRFSAILDSLLSLIRNSFRQSNHSITICPALEMVGWKTARGSPRNESMPRRKVTNTKNHLLQKTRSYASRHSINPDDTTTGAVNLAKRTMVNSSTNSPTYHPMQNFWLSGRPLSVFQSVLLKVPSPKLQDLR
jgi:hypothetical protein